VEPQVEQLVGGIQDVLREDLLGAYLHGSAVLGGLRPRSDIDVIVVSTRRTSADEKRRLVELLLALLVRGSVGPPRPIELDVVVQSEIRPWRYPPAFDFHFSELWRKDFERGELEPWPADTNRDLASVVTMALLGETALFGPPPVEMFDPVPRRDYIDAILRDTATVDQYLSWDARNVVLTLPRIWSAIATDEVHSKDSAAVWALPQLPEEHRPVLERALAIYRGGTEEPWDDILPQVRAYADYIVCEIERRDTVTRPD
jgi:predicted nucleotidyltransferase